ncbi:cobalt uptake protein COT1 [Verticillium dahliae VdLs.17]|uniref:Cobalt uptake protein COT1 n=1 Tax=Verticillium dahliae (strain VdLs.17 / ATCC MYA-4575 / FGSC 10137) TaxID=498257 RepID=G2WXS0_VERDV|nr:cobalt uptake protein COT1 [Verticillium dahliae VdLs.17]EGY20878.1 cobalt uptake protein COT1 [Verticillium dahliae VdLs.17]
MAWSKSTRIGIMLAIDVVFFITELTVGLLVKSLALLADAFHMLNDIISLCVGLWAVAVVSKATTDKYSYGWLRAEILGAFFNAVFLIALCVSILLEAISRFFDPPDIQNPQLILIVGSIGLASNLIGFLVLGGHGHDHGHGDHDYDHDHGEHDHSHSHEHAAEEGRVTATDRNNFAISNDDGPAIDVLPEFAVARATEGAPTTPRRIRFDSESESPNNRGSSNTRGCERERRRASSLRHSRLTSIDDIGIYPSSFRQEIIDASRPRSKNLDGTTDESDAEDSPVQDGETSENTPLLNDGNGNTSYKSTSRHRSFNGRPRRDSSLQCEHNHNKPQDGKKGGYGHSHGDMGLNGLILHVIGDALGNIGMYADPAVSLFITLIILKSALPLTFATSKILLQATPDHIDLQDIREDIEALPGVVSCHHVHIWQLSDTKIVGSMHVQVSFPISAEGGEKYMVLAKRARKCLHANGIHSATIQPEFLSSAEHALVEDSTALKLDGAGDHVVVRKTSCLLECVEDCVGKGCCSTGTTVAGSSPQSHHSHSPSESPHWH